MRNLIFILIATVAIQSCNQAKDHYSIQVDLDDTEGKWVRLMSLDDRKYVVSDSVFAEAGTPAVMRNSVVGVRTMYLTVEDGQGSIQLLIENTQYDITGQLESPVIKTDGKAQSDMNAYNDELKYWNCEGAELYGVPAIPHAVLIDRDGIITAKKLHGDELREAIESLL